MKRLTAALTILLICLALTGGNVMALTIKSSSFSDGELMDAKYTGLGDDISPQLSWEDVPEGTRSFALICDDPDAPFMTWVHWVVYDIPSNVAELPEGVPKEETLSTGAKQGRNDFRKIGYGGPYPPPGKPHRYFFKLYALDEMLDLEPRLTKKALLNLIEDHIIEEAQILGKFKR